MIFLGGCSSLQSHIPILSDSFEFEKDILSLALSPDGTTLAIGFDDGAIELWDVNQKSIALTLGGHISGTFVTDLKFSPVGDVLASAGSDKTAKLWQVSDGKLLNNLEEHAGPVTSISFSPDGQTVATASWDTKVRLWRVSNGELLHTLDHFPNQVYDVEFSPKGNMLASTAGTLLYLWKTDGEKIGNVEGHVGPVWDVTFAPDGETLVTASEDKTVRLWQTNDGTFLKAFELAYPPIETIFVSDMPVLLVNIGWGIEFWGIDSGEKLEDIFYTSGNQAIDLTQDGRTLVTDNSRRTLQFWQMPEFPVTQ
jgi:WD40 repeat protein